MNFVSKAIQDGGRIAPIFINAEDTNGTGLFNPSVYNDNGKLILNLRHCQYTILQAERKIFEHQFGPLIYLHPEDELKLKTTNFLCELGDDLFVKNYSKVDTSLLDVPPVWEFVGHEDCRVVRWDGKLYLSGVRRDTTPNGEGRMELSGIEIENGFAKEVSRQRIPSIDPNSYCEKNWMPILDMPYHYVKWSNPTEIVQVNVEDNTCKTVFMGNPVQYHTDIRGGSQVIRFDEKYRIACAHTVQFCPSEVGYKDGQYKHVFLVWDNDWNLVKITNEFSFLDCKIEFCAGIASHNNNIILSFGYQDNAAFVVEVPRKLMESIIYG